MPLRSSLIYTDDPGSLPAQYVVPPGVELIVQSIVARFKGQAASGAFYPALAIYSQDGRLVGRFHPSTTLAVGDTAEVTFAPFLTDFVTAGELGKPTAFVTRPSTSLQSIPNNALTAVSFTTVAWDTHGLFSAGQPTRLTPNKAGYWWVTASTTWAANAVGSRMIQIRESGVTLSTGNRVPAVPAGALTRQQVFGVFRVTDPTTFYLESIVLQDSGGALNVNADACGMTCYFLGSL